MAFKFNVVVPARYESTRLPGKPLADIAGKPMIQHVYERALISGAEQVLVATDDQRIVDAVEKFSGAACLTAATHLSGSDRIVEAIALQGWSDDTVIVNVQGDEPMIQPELIAKVAADLVAHPDAGISTLCVPIEDEHDIANENVVKLVQDAAGYALYFSRSTIPHSGTTAVLKRHIGIYAYRATFLKWFTGLEVCELERLERLEQLRALYHGAKIHVVEIAAVQGHGVDTKDDLQRVRELMINE